ncbi:sulfatase, partial [Verrucomicrobiota bacterium]
MELQKPNILVLFTDMQRADTIHALGNHVIRTPHLDRLVREGTAFTNCFSPSPVCVSARCCMHYGMYPQRTGLFSNGRMMDDNGSSYPAVLGQNGYRTHAIGKCHFTPDTRALRGFQSRQTQEEGTSDPEKDDYIAWLRDNGYDYYEPHGARGEMYYIPQVSTLPVEAHPSQWIGNEADRFIRESSAQARPWCLFASFIHPHPPFAPPKPWHKLYRAPAMPLPLAVEHAPDLYTWINRFQNRYKYRDRGLDLNLLRVIKAYYYATISFVDNQLGRILDALERTGQLDDTLIVFTSDHGEHLGDLGCFGKRSMHD